ncbi:hypothetical protein FRC17_009938 [Serendipita sp. 399]|nr:hypothetical protein FRC17_009938 [Serendipita sp. 399]
MAAISNWSLSAITSPARRDAEKGKTAKNEDEGSVDRVDLSLDLSITGFKTLKEAAEVIPVAGEPLKAICGIMVLILQLAKRCNENREGWERLAVIAREKNESIIALLTLYGKAPQQYPSAERQAIDYQRILESIAMDIKRETQKRSEASQGLETYWSRMLLAGRNAVLANINSEKITSYQEQLQSIAFDVIEKTVVNLAIAINDKGMLTEQSKTTAVLKPRPRLVEDFIGREDILSSMHQTHFDNDGSRTRHNGPIVTVLTALGGSGKTQIAVKFASMFEEKFPSVPIFFVDGSSEASLKADLDTLVRSYTDSYDDALVWLATAIDNWLLIIDNADDPSVKLSQYLPRSSHGHVIVTTRDATRKALAPRSTHFVDMLPIEDSIKLLLTSSRCEDNEVNRSFAKDIVKELERLPLALAHAAAYILINDCLDTFLKSYSESRSQFLQRTPDLQQDYNYSVEGTIEMSFRRLPPSVQEMMHLFAYLDSRSIARCIIEKAARRTFLHIPQQTNLPPHADTVRDAEVLTRILCPSGVWKAFEFDGMIEECLKYSLLRLSTAEGEKFYLMHPLVQKYLQSTSNSIQDCSVYSLIIRLLASSITTGQGYYAFFEFSRLSAPHIRIIHVEEVTEAGDHYGFGNVLYEIGDSLASIHLERSVKIWRESHGDDAKCTLDSIGVLAIVYCLLGREMDALPLQEEVLQKQRALLGPDHLNTLMAMNNLASTYESLGRAMDALLLKEEVLQKWRALLGPDHLDTLMAMNNLAGTYKSLGRAMDALPLQEEVLQKWRALLGPDHLNTLSAMNNLASTYESLGRAMDALPLKEEVLQKRRALLGPDHLNTLSAMNNLASTYKSLGRAMDALPLQEEVLQKRRALLGPDHLDTLGAMNNLANTYQSLGRAMDALPLQEEVLQKQRALLGPDHLNTLRAMNNLANTYQLLGRAMDALPLQEEVLQKQRALLGPDHLNTLRAMNNLANTYQLLGRAMDALPLQEEVLQKQRALLGPDHLDTLRAMNNLASTYYSLHRANDALPLYKEVVDRRQQLLGPGHRETVDAMFNLLLTFSRLNIEDDLVTLVKIVLPLHEQIYGPDHENTVWIRSLIK